MKIKVLNLFLVTAFLAGLISFQGCSGEYTHGWDYPETVETVYVEMFDSRSFRRGYEYELTDAVCKLIEAQTPYKIVSDRDRADTLMTGEIVSIGSSVMSWDREYGTSLENEAIVNVNVTWKNLRSGVLFIDSETVTASANYAEKLDQDVDYGIHLASNRVAKKIVDKMQREWN